MVWKMTEASAAESAVREGAGRIWREKWGLVHAGT